MKQIRISFTAEEALMVVTALGTYQNRIGQHSSWSERKRIPTLRRLASEAESETELNSIHAKMEKEQGYISRCIAQGKECNELKERVKQLAGITDERMLTRKEERELV